MDLDKAKETLQSYATVIGANWSQNMSQKKVDALTGLIEETEKHQKPDEEISDTWVTLTSSLEENRKKPDEGSDTGVLLGRLDAAKKRAKKAEEGKEDAEKVADAAQKELRKAKAGSPPPCLHEPGIGTNARGPSISLGAIYINTELIELVDINRRLLSLNAVDFIGRRVDYDTKVYDLISSWPEDEPLTFEEFSSLAQPIVEIGNIDSDLKLKCMFTMNYYDEAGTSYDTIKLRFLRYFLSQRKLSQDELSNFRRN